MKRLVLLGMGFLLLLSVFLIPAKYLALASPSHIQGSKIGVLSMNALRLKKVVGLKAGLKQCSFGGEPEFNFKALNADDDRNQLALLAERLVHEQPDILVAAGAPETRALQTARTAAKKSIPIVFMGTLSPARIGLVDDVARPTGNITGLDNYHLDLTPKRLELLHCLLPKVKRIGVLGDSRINFYSLAPKTLEKVAQRFELELDMYSVTDWNQVESVFQTMKINQIEAVLLLPGFFLETTTTDLIDAAQKAGLPLFGVYPEDAEKGCLASFGTSYYRQGIQSAHLVYKILSGCKPEELPVETPDHVDFVVNLKSARELGVEPTESVLSLADRIIP